MKLLAILEADRIDNDMRVEVIGIAVSGDDALVIGEHTWAKNAMTLLVKTGTVGGNGGKLNPTGTTTRAEMAQVLYNLLGR
jgi:hypothetical protein